MSQPPILQTALSLRRYISEDRNLHNRRCEKPTIRDSGTLWDSPASFWGQKFLVYISV
jgi:hypothetical protein